MKKLIFTILLIPQLVLAQKVDSVKISTLGVDINGYFFEKSSNDLLILNSTYTTLFIRLYFSNNGSIKTVSIDNKKLSPIADYYLYELDFSNIVQSVKTITIVNKDSSTVESLIKIYKIEKPRIEGLSDGELSFPIGSTVTMSCKIKNYFLIDTALTKQITYPNLVVKFNHVADDDYKVVIKTTGNYNETVDLRVVYKKQYANIISSNKIHSLKIKSINTEIVKINSTPSYILFNKDIYYKICFVSNSPIPNFNNKSYQVKANLPGDKQMATFTLTSTDIRENRYYYEGFLQPSSIYTDDADLYFDVAASEKSSSKRYQFKFNIIPTPTDLSVTLIKGKKEIMKGPKLSLNLGEEYKIKVSGANTTGDYIKYYLDDSLLANINTLNPDYAIFKLSIKYTEDVGKAIYYQIEKGNEKLPRVKIADIEYTYLRKAHSLDFVNFLDLTNKPIKGDTANFSKIKLENYKLRFSVSNIDNDQSIFGEQYLTVNTFLKDVNNEIVCKSLRKYVLIPKPAKVDYAPVLNQLNEAVSEYGVITKDSLVPINMLLDSVNNDYYAGDKLSIVIRHDTTKNKTFKPISYSLINTQRTSFYISTNFPISLYSITLSKQASFQQMGEVSSAALFNWDFHKKQTGKKSGWRFSTGFIAQNIASVSEDEILKGDSQEKKKTHSNFGACFFISYKFQSTRKSNSAMPEIDFKFGFGTTTNDMSHYNFFMMIGPGIDIKFK